MQFLILFMIFMKHWKKPQIVSMTVYGSCNKSISGVGLYGGALGLDLPLAYIFYRIFQLDCYMVAWVTWLAPTPPREILLRLV